MIVAATQIRIKGILGFFRFIPMVNKTKNQVSKVDGLIFLKFYGLSTLSGWESHDAMIAFRNNGHHLEAMTKVKYIGKTKSVTWEAEVEPSWKEAKEKLDLISF